MSKSVEELCELGNELADHGRLREALSCFQEALKLIPASHDNKGTYVWVLVAIGDTQFLLNEYLEAVVSFEQAYSYEPNNPFINLRLGECYFETSNYSKARSYLLQAYMLDGTTVFEGESFKYLQSIKDLIK